MVIKQNFASNKKVYKEIIVCLYWLFSDSLELSLWGNSNEYTRDKKIFSAFILKIMYSQTCLIRPQKVEQFRNIIDRWSLNAVHKYCRKLRKELSAVLMDCIKWTPVYNGTKMFYFCGRLIQVLLYVINQIKPISSLGWFWFDKLSLSETFMEVITIKAMWVLCVCKWMQKCQ